MTEYLLGWSTLPSTELALFSKPNGSLQLPQRMQTRQSIPTLSRLPKHSRLHLLHSSFWALLLPFGVGVTQTRA